MSAWYEPIETLYRNKHSHIMRARIVGDLQQIKQGETVIIKTHVGECATVLEVERFRQEYNIAKKLNDSEDSKNIIRYFALLEKKTENGVTLALVIENNYSKNLLAMLPPLGFDVHTFVKYAIQITKGIQTIHNQKIVHKDIKTSNIIVDKDGNILLIDFGCATRLQEEVEQEHARNMQLIYGTLAYISPEQTGRINRTVDYRTDFYSLGITFYQLLCGYLPFRSDDVMTIIHNHIANNLPPFPLHLPQVLNDIVNKLTKKDAEERYQSCSGLLYDLQQCQDALNTYNSLQKQKFLIGTNDLTDRLMMSKKLYGREKEITDITNIFESICSSGRAELLLVSGSSGIGKSSLVRDVQKHVQMRGGHFVSSKYDQLERNISYSAISDALKSLLSQIFGDSSCEEVSMWRKRVMNSFKNESAQLLVGLVPLLEELIGQQQPMPQLSVSESKNKLKLLFSELIHSLAIQTSPLVLFIDDMQWSDIETVSLIQDLLENSTCHLMVIMAYRDNEVGPEHHLNTMIKTLRDVVKIHDIVLSPLNAETVHQWIAETVQTDIEREISDLVYNKTGGNPFFVKLFMHTLYEKKILRRDPSRHTWIWNVQALREAEATMNMVDLMTQRIDQLEGENLESILWLSCFGREVEVKRLALSMERSVSELMEHLYPALNAGLLILNGSRIEFTHDRVQECAYKHLDNGKREYIHYIIGQRWLNVPNVLFTGKELCEVMDHVNKGLSYINKDVDICKRMIGMNMDAGATAYSSTAYSTALTYYYAATCLFINLCETEEEAWSKYHKLGFNSYLNVARVKSLLLKHDEALQICEMILLHTQDKIERAIIYTEIITLHTSKVNFSTAIETGTEALKLFNIEMPLNVSDAERVITKQKQNIRERLQQLKSVIINDDIDLSSLLITPDESMQTLYDIFVRMVTVLYAVSPVYTAAVASIAANIMLRTAITAESSQIFGFYAMYLFSESSEFEQGCLIAKIIIKCVREIFPEALPQRTKALHVYSFFVHSWCKPIWQIFNYTREATNIGMLCGELFFAAYVFMPASAALLYSGENINNALEELQSMSQISQKQNNHFTVLWMTHVSTIMRHLCDITLTLEVIDAEKKNILSTAKNASGMMYAEHLIMRLIIDLVMKCDKDICKRPLHATKLHEKLSLIDSNLAAATGMYANVYFVFLGSLLMLREIRLDDNLDPQLRTDFMNRINKNREQLRIWSSQCEVNFKNKHLLVEAEYTSYVMKDAWSAVELYESAIKEGINNKFIHEAALASELLYKLMTKKSKSMAKPCLQQAFDLYNEWGAKRKVKQMIEDYPDLIVQPQKGLQSTFTMTQDLNSLDLQGLIRTSQVISSNIDMDKLLSSVIDVIIEVAGATKASIIIGDKVEAQLSFQRDKTNVMCNIPLDLWMDGPRDIIKHVIKTGKEVITGCAYQDESTIIRQDPYVVKNLSKSILCMPIIYQGDLQGVLYLSNDLMSDCFMTERVIFLSLLANQLAISIQHSKHFENEMRSLQQIHKMEKFAELHKKRAEDEESNRRKQEEFIDHICHEIRNPIQGIVGNCEQLTQILESVSGILDSHILSSLQSCVKSIEECSRYQRIVTDDTLTLSKLELHKLGLNLAPVKIQEIVDSVMTMNNVEAKRKNINLICEFKNITEDTLTIIDGTRLSMVMINLITNAIKFTSRGSVTIFVKMTSLDETSESNDRNLEFRIRDTGYGMSEAEMKNLFNRFTQATQRISSQYGGSGLGLFISKGVVELMGGTVQVSSEKGVGSEFKFTIRTRLADEQEMKQYRKTREESSPPWNERRKSKGILRVLIAEDNNINQRVMVRMFERCECECVVANDGLEALNIYRDQGPFDLITMDVVMPKMNGYESTSAIRQIELDAGKNEHILIVGLSGNVRQEYHDLGTEAGMDQFLNKPISFESIRNLVNSLR